MRQRLEAANPQLAEEVPTAVKEATRRARSAPSAITEQTAIAHALVKSLYEDGRLDEFQVAAFAEAGKFDETNAVDRGACQRAGRDRREHDDRDPRRGRHDPGQGLGPVMVDRAGDHQHARRTVGRGADRSAGLQGHLRTAAALDRAAGAALPPHAAEHARRRREAGFARQNFSSSIPSARRSRRPARSRACTRSRRTAANRRCNATLYASHCTDDSPLFVATWYTIATALVAAVGALAGSRC